MGRICGASMSEESSRATTCYMAQQGVAYQLWAYVEAERVRRGWTGVQMAQHLGLPRNTIARLKSATARPQASTVRAIADGLGLDYERAAQMAGLLTPDRPERGINAREAILRDPAFNDEQREALLRVLDL